MQVALISDIHGNLVALEAVLQDLSHRQVDQMLCLGDVASSGPQPREVVQRLRGLQCPVVMGNADAELLATPVSASSRWTAQQLPEESLGYIRTFAPSIEVPLGGVGTLLCFHGSPRSYDDMIMATTPFPDLDEMLGGRRATVMAGGHTHVQMVRRHRDVIIVNPGSVGLPYDKNPWTGEVPSEAVRLAPWAEYALVACEGGRISVELLRVPLAVDQVKKSALTHGWPAGPKWADSWMN